MKVNKNSSVKNKNKREPISNKKFLIIILIISAILIIGLLIYRWQVNKKYQGYWCSYIERSQIVVLLKDGHTAEQDQDLLKKIEGFDNVVSTNYNAKEDFESELGTNPDIYDAYVINFSSLDSIGTYIEDLNSLDYVVSAAKTNVSLYNIKSSSKYTFTDSDEASESDLETGKYKIRNGVIVFTPDNKELETKLLYIKNDHLCENADCTRVFAASNSSCGSKDS